MFFPPENTVSPEWVVVDSLANLCLSEPLDRYRSSTSKLASDYVRHHDHQSLRHANGALAASKGEMFRRRGNLESRVKLILCMFDWT